jgi:outer membrane protein assembly factor BamE (lipoprotein component of BamABCDE complex)
MTKQPAASVHIAYSAIISIAITVFGLFGMSGCASNPDRVAAGATRDEVLRSYGAPTADIRTPGGERLQYSRQPFGQQVYNIDLNAEGKVVTVTQALTMAEFARVQLDVWRVADVQLAFGRPALVAQVFSFKGDVWSYRYDYFGTNKQFHVFIDPQGVVRRTQSTDEIERLERDL